MLHTTQGAKTTTIAIAPADPSREDRSRGVLPGVAGEGFGLFHVCSPEYFPMRAGVEDQKGQTGRGGRKAATGSHRQWICGGLATPCLVGFARIRAPGVLRCSRDLRLCAELPEPTTGRVEGPAKAQPPEIHRPRRGSGVVSGGGRVALRSSTRRPRCENDHRLARSPYRSLPHSGDRKRQLSLQGQRRNSEKETEGHTSIDAIMTRRTQQPGGSVLGDNAGPVLSDNQRINARGISAMRLKHIIRQVGPDRNTLLHVRSPLWILADPHRHISAFGGWAHHQRQPCQPTHLRSDR